MLLETSVVFECQQSNATKKGLFCSQHKLVTGVSVLIYFVCVVSLVLIVT
jgi:hypothetical protein